MHTILLTGFEPFGSHTVNPSALVAGELEGTRIGEHTVVSTVLPVSMHAAPDVLSAAIERHRPTVTLALGLAYGRAQVALERVALNVLDFPMPDNSGDQPTDGPVVPGGPDAYLSTLPLKSTLAAWHAAGMPGYLSNTAGTYLCNAVFYHACHLGQQHGSGAGFIHLPALPGGVVGSDEGTPSMALETMVRAVHLALESFLAPARAVLPIHAGALH